MELELEAGVGAEARALHGHRLGLVVVRLYTVSLGAQRLLVGPQVQAHVAHQSDTSGTLASARMLASSAAAKTAIFAAARGLE